jgi:hypothetical protein
MRPNLSLDHIAMTLAALGTTALVSGCGGEAPAPQVPVQSVEVTTPAPAAAVPAAPAPAVAAAAVTTPAVSATVATPAAAGAMPGPSTPTAAAPAPTGATAATAAVAAGTTPAKPKAPATTKKAGANGQASCGAGTCSASK